MYIVKVFPRLLIKKGKKKEKRRKESLWIKRSFAKTLVFTLNF